MEHRQKKRYHWEDLDSWITDARGQNGKALVEERDQKKRKKQKKRRELAPPPT